MLKKQQQKSLKCCSWGELGPKSLILNKVNQSSAQALNPSDVWLVRHCDCWQVATVTPQQESKLHSPRGFCSNVDHKHILPHWKWMLVVAISIPKTTWDGHKCVLLSVCWINWSVRRSIKGSTYYRKSRLITFYKYHHELLSTNTIYPQTANGSDGTPNELMPTTMTNPPTKPHTPRCLSSPQPLQTGRVARGDCDCTPP